jgi:hypothetical protein
MSPLFLKVLHINNVFNYFVYAYILTVVVKIV